MQHFLKPVSRTARAGIVPAKFLKEFLLTMDDAEPALNLGFGRETLAAFAAGLVEKSCCSLQSLLPDGFACHITESELLNDFTLSLSTEPRNCRRGHEVRDGHMPIIPFLGWNPTKVPQTSENCPFGQ